MGGNSKNDQYLVAKIEKKSDSVSVQLEQLSVPTLHLKLK